MPSKSEVRLILDPTLRLKQLSDVGSGVNVDNAVPVQRYLRSGPQMEKMARTYYAEGQLEQAFILYNKFATLFVEKLPKHSGYAKAPATDRIRVKKLLKPAFERAMDLKEKLRVRYEEEKKMYLEQQKQDEIEQKRNKENENKHVIPTPVPIQPSTDTNTIELPKSQEPQPMSQEPQPTSKDPQQTTVPLNFDPNTSPESKDHQDPANNCHVNIKLTTEESVDPEDSWTPCDDALLLSNNQTFFYDDYEEGNEGEVSETAGLTATNENLSKVLPDSPIERRADHPTTLVVPDKTKPVHTQSTAFFPQTTSQLPPPNNTQYTSPPIYSPNPSPTYSPQPVNYSSYQPPPYNQQPNITSFPVNPAHESYLRSSSYPLIQQPSFVTNPPATPPGVSTGYPVVDRSAKPHDDYSRPYVLTSLGGLEGGIRPIILPNDVASRFLTAASSNTRKNVETCGIIGGKLVRNKFRVSHIIIPKQTGQSDSCETLNEEEIFGVQDNYDLITLGWIHTHPSQTSFMSSVDLHTHCSYQLMLEEAIAIVCAPKYSQVGVFTLTQSHGLNYISKCSGKGFHTHPKEPPIYEDCSHVEYDGSVSVQIIDLR